MQVVAVGVIIAVVISFVQDHGIMPLAYRTCVYLPPSARQAIGRSLVLLTPLLSSTELRLFDAESNVLKLFGLCLPPLARLAVLTLVGLR